MSLENQIAERAVAIQATRLSHVGRFRASAAYASLLEVCAPLKSLKMHAMELVCLDCLGLIGKDSINLDRQLPSFEEVARVPGSFRQD